MQKKSLPIISGQYNFFSKPLSRKSAIFYMILAALLWSTAGFLIKLVDMHPMAIAGIRSGIAALVSLPLVKWDRNMLTPKFIVGTFMYAFTVIFFVTANKTTSSANAIFLQNTAPIWVALFSGFILKEKIRVSDWITILVVFSGMGVFLIGNLTTGRLMGDIFGLISGVFFAGMVISLKSLPKGAPFNMVVIGNILTFIIGIPFYFNGLPNTTGILSLLALGVFQIGLAYLFYTRAVEHLSAVESILIPVLEPIFNPIWVLLFVGEAPTIPTLIGGCVVITALVLRGIYQTKVPLKSKVIIKEVA